MKLHQELTMRFFFYFLFFFAAHQYSFGQSISLAEIAGPFPWLLGFEMPPNDNRFYTIRQNGYIVIIDENNPTEETVFLDISQKVNLEGEQGLLGLTFHPNYEINGQFFVYYCAAGTKKSTLSRFYRHNDNANFSDSNSEEILLTFDQPTIKHNAGCLQFGPDGYLYIASGDGGDLNDIQGYGQKTNTFLGKMLRIDVNTDSSYLIPDNNPFKDLFYYYPEIWATGLRNPWRFSFDRLTGDLWIADVGQEVWEEINFQAAGDTLGQNYGWSCREGNDAFNGNTCTDTLEFSDPIFQYTHNDDVNCSGSITGGFVYRGMENGDLFGKYIYADFCTGTFSALHKNGDEIVNEIIGNFNPFDFISFSENHNGELYVMSYFSGKIFKITSSNCEPTSYISEPEQSNICNTDSLILTAFSNQNANFSFQWQKNGANILGANSSTLSVTESADYQIITTNSQNGCTAISEAIFIDFQTQDTTFLFQEICEGDSLFFGNEFLNDAGTYEQYFSNQTGCDSIVFLDLNVLPNETEEIFSAIELPFSYNGIPIENDTIIIENWLAQNGCDSLVIIHFSTLSDLLENDILENEFTIIPNPIQDIFQLKTTPNSAPLTELEIYNSFGQNVSHQFYFNQNRQEIQRQDAATGVYFLSIKVGKQQEILRFVCL